MKQITLVVAKQTPLPPPPPSQKKQKNKTKTKANCQECPLSCSFTTILAIVIFKMFQMCVCFDYFKTLHSKYIFFSKMWCNYNFKFLLSQQKYLFNYKFNNFKCFHQNTHFKCLYSKCSIINVAILNISLRMVINRQATKQMKHF